MTNISNPFVITCLHFPQKTHYFYCKSDKRYFDFLRCYNIRNFVGSRMIKLVILNRFSFVIQPNIHI